MGLPDLTYFLTLDVILDVWNLFHVVVMVFKILIFFLQIAHNCNKTWPFQCLNFHLLYDSDYLYFFFSCSISSSSTSLHSRNSLYDKEQIRSSLNLSNTLWIFFFKNFCMSIMGSVSLTMWRITTKNTFITSCIKLTKVIFPLLCTKYLLPKTLK